MKQIKHFLSNLLQAANLGTFLFFSLNLGVLLLLFGTDADSCAALAALYLMSLAISFSSPGQALLCAANGARKMTRLDMRGRVLPAAERVYAAAKRASPALPNRIRIRIMYDPNPNAFAIGRNTICVTEGLLDLPEDVMTGLIAHEMGHLALQHTLIQTLIGGGNLVITALLLILKLFGLLFSAASVFSVLSRGGIFHLLAGLFSAVSAGALFVWTKICMLILMKSGRENEYAADAYAFRIGYGNELAKALDRLNPGTPQPSFLKALSSAQPEPGDRIGRLHALGAVYSRY